MYKAEAIATVRFWVPFLLMTFFLCQCGSKEKSGREAMVWRKLGPGGGGATFIPTFSFDSPEKFALRCDMTGSYATKDGGESYHQFNFPNGAQSFAYDPQNSEVIYAGGSALYRSSDGGNHWEQLFPRKEAIESVSFKGDHGSYSIKTAPGCLYNADAGSIGNIKVDPLNSDWLYLSMGKSFLYSKDRGANWTRKDLDGPIQFLTANKNPLLIFTLRKMYTFDKSSAAMNEQLLPGAMSPVTSFTGGVSRESGALILYALHDNHQKNAAEEFRESEVWVSSDAGKTWAKAMDPILNNDRSGFKPSYSMISASERDGGHAYIVADRYLEKTAGKNRHWYGALKTADGGKSWDWVWKGGGGSGQYGVKDGVGVSNLRDAWVEKAFGGEYIRLMDVGVYPQDGNIAIVTDWYRTMKTTDGGKSWREVYGRQQDSTFVSRGLDVTTAYGVHFDPFDSAHVAISYTDIGYHHSYNGGKSWARSVKGVPVEWQNTCYWIVFDPDIKDKVWSAWSNLHDFPRGKMTRDPTWKDRARGGVCLSLDGGKTWTPYATGMDSNSATTSIVLDQHSPPGMRTLYAAVFNKGVFKSTDDGKTWQLKNNGIANNTCAFELTLRPDGMLFLVVSPTPKHEGGARGRGYYPGAVYRSADGAETWTKADIGEAVIFPNGIACDPKNPNRIYLACWSDIMLSDLVGAKIARETGGDSTLGTAGGIFMSEDSGTTWTSVFDQSKYVYDVTVDPNHEGRIYCNTFNAAAYRSDDYGKTWSTLNGYDFHWGHRVVINPWHTDKLYLTTYGSSVWESN